MEGNVGGKIEQLRKQIHTIEQQYDRAKEAKDTQKAQRIKAELDAPKKQLERFSPKKKDESIEKRLGKFLVEDKYAKLKPIPGEKKYVEEEDGYFHIFGEKSGFSYSQHKTEKDAKDKLK